MKVLQSFLKSSSGIIKYTRLNTSLLNTRLLRLLLVPIEDIRPEQRMHLAVGSFHFPH